MGMAIDLDLLAAETAGPQVAATLLGTSPGSASTSARKASPRTSKLRYWSNEAQAGDSSTTGSEGRNLPDWILPHGEARGEARAPGHYGLIFGS